MVGWGSGATASSRDNVFFRSAHCTLYCAIPRNSGIMGGLR